MNNFYQKQTAFFDFKELMNDEHYQTVPSSWWVILTDVKGSTVAVKEGKYRDVNMVGALGITAILNATKASLPFVFGGDGGTILVPPELKNKAIEAVRSALFVAREMYNLELRAGVVAVEEIVKKGKKIEVAKYELSKGNNIAQFRGGGLALAEEMIKTDSKFLLTESNSPPNLEGLTCRWAPLDHHHGTMLTLLVHVLNQDYSEYENIIFNIEKILGKKLKAASPVSMEKLKGKWPPPIHLETKSKANKSNYWQTYCKVFLNNVFVYFFTLWNLDMGKFSMKKYKAEMLLNSDYKKFDDTLRMVIDCSKEQSQEIQEMLAYRQDVSPLVYGTHESTQAVMTCLVFSAENNEHIHFIDGSHGGYTQAAVEMKAQIKALSKAA